MVMRQRGAVPQAYNANADPKTWDWNPTKVRYAMRQGQAPRKCNDCCWAIALILTLCAFIGFAVYGFMNMDFKIESLSEEAKEKGKWTIWKCVLQLAIASAFGIIFALVWSCILRCCAGAMIKISIFTYIGLKVVALVMCFIQGGPMMYMAIPIGIILLISIIYFACVWRRIPMAEATLSIATKVIHRYSCVFWISLLFTILTVVYIFVMVFGYFGLVTMIRGDDFTWDREKDGEDWCGWALRFGTFFVNTWGCITIGYIVHAICAGVMGTWYFGTSRKRTVTDAVVRALTTSLGSLSFAAFLVAIIKTLEKMAREQQAKAEQKGDIAGLIFACIMVCILKTLGDMLKYFNSLAIVRVAVYGESFCTAAKRTMNMIKYRGMDQIINDDLSGMPIWLGCFIIFLITAPCLFATVKFILPGLTIIAFESDPEGENAVIWIMSFLFSICSLFIPFSILSVIPSFTQSLYVLWGDDPAALDSNHPQEARMLKAAAWECHGYRVVYDDHRITGRA